MLHGLSSVRYRELIHFSEVESEFLIEKGPQTSYSKWNICSFQGCGKILERLRNLPRTTGHAVKKPEPAHSKEDPCI